MAANVNIGAEKYLLMLSPDEWVNALTAMLGHEDTAPHARLMLDRLHILLPASELASRSEVTPA